MSAPTAEPKTAEPKTATPAKAEERRLRLLGPFGIAEELREEMSRLWGQRPLLTPRPLAHLAEGEWMPRVDVYQKNASLMVKAELPGMTKEDIKVEMDDGDLVISGERKSESEVREEDYYRVERAYGSFYRRLQIPFEVKIEQIKANYKDGVLEIEIPKPAQATPPAKRIAVS
jgi:HSP20 family protein